MKKNIYINRDKSNCPITLEQLMQQGLISNIEEIHDVTSNDVEKKKQLNN